MGGGVESDLDANIGPLKGSSHTRGRLCKTEEGCQDGREKAIPGDVAALLCGVVALFWLRCPERGLCVEQL